MLRQPAVAPRSPRSKWIVRRMRPQQSRCGSGLPAAAVAAAAAATCRHWSPASAAN